jgi:hypothetical protein
VRGRFAQRVSPRTSPSSRATPIRNRTAEHDKAQEALRNFSMPMISENRSQSSNTSSSYSNAKQNRMGREGAKCWPHTLECHSQRSYVLSGVRCLHPRARHHIGNLIPFSCLTTFSLSCVTRHQSVPLFILPIGGNPHRNGRALASSRASMRGLTRAKLETSTRRASLSMRR